MPIPFRAARRILVAAATFALLAACSDDNPVNPLGPQLIRPVDGGWISSGFGPRETHPIKGYIPGGHHDGYDFAVAAGSPIRATMDGKVDYAGWVSGYGNTVILQHANGYSTLYGHASALKVKAGQTVKTGDVIALVGSTGLSTGPHLHYELRKDGVAIDPGPYLDGTAMALANPIVPASYHVAAAGAKKAHAKGKAKARPKVARQASKAHRTLRVARAVAGGRAAHHRS